MQTISNETTRYPFLARPPQKKKPTRAPPTPVPSPPSTTLPSVPVLRRRASGIAAWVALVQPGPPAPSSPHRRLSNSSSRRPSLTHRRPSISHSRARSDSLSGLIHTPPSAQDIDIDLSALGYTSISVHVPPSTPSTPSHLCCKNMKYPANPTPEAHRQLSPKKPSAVARTVKRFRSLSVLRSRSKTGTHAVATLASPTSSRAELIASRNKTKYAHVRPPPPLANELALMQFADGGSMEKNVRRMMEAQAQAEAGQFGVGDVYRDGKGGLWWDQDEELEYAHLLGGDVDAENPPQSQWIKFGNENINEDLSLKTGIIDLAGSENESSSTQDSDLSSRFIVLPAEEIQCGPEDPVLPFTTPQKPSFQKQEPTIAATAGLSVLSLPSRPRRTAKHLHKPEFLVDMAAFGPRSPSAPTHVSPKSPLFSSPHPAEEITASPSPRSINPTRTLHSPRSARFPSTLVRLPPIPSAGKPTKVKRRPAPLQFSPVTSPASWRTVSTTSVGIVSEARREFVEASFAPRPVIHQVPAPISILTGAITTPTMAAKDMGAEEECSKSRGRIVVASLNPRDDMAKCREWAGGMVTSVDLDRNGIVDMSSNMRSTGVPPKRKLGFGALFGRK